MDEFTGGRRLHEVHRKCANDQDARGDLRRQLDDRVTATQDDRDGDDTQQESVNRKFLVVIDARNIEPEIQAKEVEHHRGGRNQTTGLPDGRLDDGGYQYIPDRDVFPCSGISIEHAAAGCMREANCHFETVVLEDVGYRRAPQQCVAISSACHRRRNQVAGADSGHHQHQARPEFTRQAAELHGGHFERLESACPAVWFVASHGSPKSLRGGRSPAKQPLDGTAVSDGLLRCARKDVLWSGNHG